MATAVVRGQLFHEQPAERRVSEGRVDRDSLRFRARGLGG